MNVIFQSNIHEQSYKNYIQDIPSYDIERQALLYLLTLDSCRQHIHDLYDFNKCCIRPDGLHCDWQTSGSKKITRLAFNLFTGSVMFEEEDKRDLINPCEIFATSDAPFLIQAIKIRFPTLT